MRSGEWWVGNASSPLNRQGCANLVNLRNLRSRYSLIIYIIQIITCSDPVCHTSGLFCCCHISKYTSPVSLLLGFYNMCEWSPIQVLTVAQVSNTIANHYCDAILSSISLWTLSIPELRGKINKMLFRRKYPCSNYNFWWKILWQLQLLQYMFLLSDTCCCPAVPRVQIHEFYVQILKIEKKLLLQIFI